MYARIFHRTVFAALAVFCLYGPAWAQTYTYTTAGGTATAPIPYIPDKFVGDTAIYTGTAQSIMPNVMFLVDDTASMGQPGRSAPYDPTITYPVNGYTTNTVYVKTAATGGTINYNQYIASINSVTCSAANTALTTTGYYPGKLKKSDGSCNTPSTGDYYMGNLLNYMFAQSNVWSASTAYTVGMVVQPVAGATYTWTCTVAGTSGTANPFPATLPSPIDWNNPPTLTESTGVTWQLSPAMISMVTSTLNQILPNVRQSIRAGLSTFRAPGGNQINGAGVWQPVDYIDQTTSGNANYTRLVSQINAITPQHVSSGGNQQPVNEAFWDLNLYYQGMNNSNTKFSQERNSYPNPITAYCQESFVVVITTGATQGSTNYSRTIGDQNGDASLVPPVSWGCVGCVEDAAILLYNTDHLVNSTLDPQGIIQHVNTIVIQLSASSVYNLVWAAAYGNGISITHDAALNMTAADAVAQGIPYYLVQSAEGLTQVLLDVMQNIVLQAHTSFVAPTIPVSQQENLRSYSGNRVYMGFFRPMTKKAWRGNMKKYGLDDNGNIVDAAGNLATYVDANGDGIDDRDGASLGTKSDGDFRPDSKSFWSALPCHDEVDGKDVILTQKGDGGVVDCGGAGEQLLIRTAPRKIYTFLTGTLTPPGYSASQDLTAPVNLFDATNGALTPELLNYLTQPEADNILALYGQSVQNFVAGSPPTGRGNLISYIQGNDAYGTNPQNYVPQVPGRRSWIMGDVLHSKPVVVGYTTYAAADENNCSKNKSMIYVGANDGMLHAFRDCDGGEEWAFIPTDLLGGLRQLAGILHVNFVDSSLVQYVYDANGNGKIGSFDGSSGANDRVFLLFGQRRGGGKNNWAALGYYFVLEVTDPLKPRLVKQISTGGAYGQLGETWSEPKLAKVRIGTTDKLVMIIGAGYDNCNEDSRFGATQAFPGACAQASTNDSGVATSTPAAPNPPLSPLGQLTPMGRGVYVLEITTLTGVVPTYPFQSPLNVIWKYTSETNAAMNYSVPSDVLLLDVNYDGYVDRFYVGDSGGSLWRFDIGDTSTTNWKATKIFSSNPGINGASDTGRKIFYRPDAMIGIGVVRLFFATGDREHPLNQAVIDRVYALTDEDGADYSGGPRTESDLVDVTLDKLQSGTQTEIDATLAALQAKHGWFVRLDGQDYLNPDGTPAPVTKPGEKALAPVSLVNGIVWATTYRPLAASTDPCVPGSEGEASALHFKYLTGEAQINFQTSNDNQYSTYAGNTRATPSQGVVLLRADRRVKLGRGIPSGIVERITPGGDIQDYVCTGGGCKSPPGGGSLGIYPLYWRQR